MGQGGRRTWPDLPDCPLLVTWLLCDHLVRTCQQLYCIAAYIVAIYLQSGVGRIDLNQSLIRHVIAFPFPA